MASVADWWSSPDLWETEPPPPDWRDTMFWVTLGMIVVGTIWWSVL